MPKCNVNDYSTIHKYILKMTQEEKDLLLQDLSARLPYGVILNCCNTIGEKLTCIDENGLINHDYDINECKPYLFPLSSMTEEQEFEFNVLQVKTLKSSYATPMECVTILQWCYKNHIDVSGLIPKGLANDATRLNIY